VPIERATFNEGLCMGIDLSGRKDGAASSDFARIRTLRRSI